MSGWKIGDVAYLRLSPDIAKTCYQGLITEVRSDGSLAAVVTPEESYRENVMAEGMNVADVQIGETTIMVLGVKGLSNRYGPTLPRMVCHITGNQTT